MFDNPNLWVLIAFLVFVVFVAIKIVPFLREKLDEKIGHIKHKLDEAARLRDEAQEILNKSKESYLSSISQAEEIISNTKSHSENVRKEFMVMLDKLSKQKEALAKNKIELLKQEIINEIRARITDFTIQACHSIIQENKHIKEESDILSPSIKALSKIIKN